MHRSDLLLLAGCLVVRLLVLSACRGNARGEVVGHSDGKLCSGQETDQARAGYSYGSGYMVGIVRLTTLVWGRDAGLDLETPERVLSLLCSPCYFAKRRGACPL